MGRVSLPQEFVFPTETLLEFTAIPGSLQEAFVKRKKSFIQRSCQRQKEIRNKTHVSENSQIKTAKEKPPTGILLLKGIGQFLFPIDAHSSIFKPLF